MNDPLVDFLKRHMRVAVEENTTIRCWCDKRFPSGEAHRIHQAELIRAFISAPGEI